MAKQQRMSVQLLLLGLIRNNLLVFSLLFLGAQASRAQVVVPTDLFPGVDIGIPALPDDLGSDAGEWIECVSNVAIMNYFL